MKTDQRVNWPKYKLATEIKELTRPQWKAGHWVLEEDYRYKPRVSFLLLILALSICWLVGSVFGSVVSSSPRQPLSILIGIITASPFMILVLFLLRESLSEWKQAKQEREFTRPVLVLPSQELEAGKTIRLTFQRRFKSDKGFPQSARLHARLIQAEGSRDSKQGYLYNVYDSEFLHEEPLESQTVVVRLGQLSATWEVTLPADAQPNYITKDSWICWQLQVMQEVAGQAPLVATFTLPVVMYWVLGSEQTVRPA